jgi:hypothetical protein
MITQGRVGWAMRVSIPKHKNWLISPTSYLLLFLLCLQHVTPYDTHSLVCASY